MEVGSVEFRLNTYLTFAKEYYKLFKEINVCENCKDCCCKDNWYYDDGCLDDWPDWAQLMHKLGIEKYGEPEMNSKMCGYLGEDGCRLKELKPLICIIQLCSKLKIKLISLGFNIHENLIKEDLYNILTGNDFKNSVKRMENRVSEIKLNLNRLRLEKSTQKGQ